MSAIPVGCEPKHITFHREVELEFAPILLGVVMRRHGITQSALAAVLSQSSGVPFSRTSLSLIINYGNWPKLTPREDLKLQIEARLRERGVTDQEIRDCWEPDPGSLLARNHHHARPPRPAMGARAEADSPQLDIPEKEMLSPVARKHFQLFRDPFTDEIRGPEDLYLAADQHYIRESMYQTAKNGGFIAVVGESGAGKTTLCDDLMDRVQRDSQPILFIRPRVIDKKKMTARMVCEAILDDLSPGTAPHISLERLARKVEKILIESHKAGNRHVLLIDEAQDLQPLALKHLKRFYELRVGHSKLLSIILVGQPELQHLLDERQHHELREVIRRCQVAELSPLDKNVQDYLKLKFDRAGKKLEEIFAADAFDAIIARLTTADSRRGRVSMVYPLVVNNVVSKAMNLAANMSEAKVSADVIREV